ncbi:MAG: hypothetical protein J5925_05535 [Clostridia bacterium]|nr:hypothetical protein [Clostridia bacterium]
MKVSFGKISTKGTFAPVWPYGTDLYGRFIYLEKDGACALIAAFDFSGTQPKEANRWRREVSALTGIPAGALWYHELQIHAAPYGEQLKGEPMDKIIARSAEEINRMRANAQECDCWVCESDFGTECTFNREQYVEGLGGVTVWTGMSFDEEGRPYSRNKDIMLLRGYRPDLPVYDKPIYFDNPNDPKAYLFRFVNKKGETLGTVSRFAAHPDVAVLFELRFHPNRRNEYHYNYDWPGYMSESFEQKYGGISIYLNGPCADLSTKKGYEGLDLYADAERECKRLAKWFGEKLSADFDKNAVKIDTEAVFKAETFDIHVPIKEDIPDSLEELRTETPRRVAEAQEKLDKAIAEGAPAYAVKRLIDDRWRIGAMPHAIIETLDLTDEELKSRRVTVRVAALRFGGYLFVGVPGESLVDMTLWLRSQFTGVKTVPVDQVDGYYNYMATPRSMTLGGYTYWQSWVAREGIPAIKRELTKLLGEFMKD